MYFSFLLTDLNYTTLPGADPTTNDLINISIVNMLENEFSNYFDFNEDDLYRADAPEWVYYWGSNRGMANIGNISNILAKYNISPTLNNTLRRKAAEQLHYFHGVNPQGLVYLSNMYE